MYILYKFPCFPSNFLILELSSLTYEFLINKTFGWDFVNKKYKTRTMDFNRKDWQFLLLEFGV